MKGWSRKTWAHGSVSQRVEKQPLLFVNLAMASDILAVCVSTAQLEYRGLVSLAEETVTPSEASSSLLEKSSIETST